MRSLRVRLPLLAAAILAVALGLSILLAFEIVVAVGHRDLAIVLERERDRFAASIAELLEDTSPDLPFDERLEQAGVRYLALNPANDVYAKIIRIDGRRALISTSGPAVLRPLLEADRIPVSEPGFMQTVDTVQGEVRSLVTPITVDGARVGLYQVVAPLDPISDATDQSLLRMLLVAGVSLVIGALLLGLTLYRALRPLSQLAGAARAIDYATLGERVREPAQQDEVGQLARELNAMLARLDEAARSRQQFLAAVSHELRTPITILRGHVETLDQLGGGVAVVSETAGVLREELERVGRLVEDLLALARSETPGFVVRQPTSVRRLLDDLRLRLSGLGAEDVTLHAPPDIWVQADANRLGQALINLIVNARVHTPPGTAITVGARVEGGSAALFVSDNGPGIDPAIRERVLEPFVHGMPGPTGYQSTGLGMSVVRAIVDAHNGALDVRSDTTGTEITIRLPTGAPPGAAHGTVDVPAPDGERSTARGAAARH